MVICHGGNQQTPLIYRVLKGGGCPRGGGNWGTLRIPREDWGTLGKGNHHPLLRNPIQWPLRVSCLVTGRICSKDFSAV